MWLLGWLLDDDDCARSLGAIPLLLFVLIVTTVEQGDSAIAKKVLLLFMAVSTLVYTEDS